MVQQIFDGIPAFFLADFSGVVNQCVWSGLDRVLIKIVLDVDASVCDLNNSGYSVNGLKRT